MPGGAPFIPPGLIYRLSWSARDLTVLKGGAKAQDLGDGPLGPVQRRNALQEHHELIINAAGEGIYGWDLRGCATFVNPAAAALTGHHVDELIGRPMHEMVHHTHEGGSAYHHRACPIYATLKDGQVHSVSNEVFWRKDGTCFPVQYTGTPIVRRGQANRSFEGYFSGQRAEEPRADTTSKRGNWEGDG